jgi:hypothetical protein
MRRLHPRLGWLWLERTDWAETMQRQAEERDRLNDASFSGPAPAFVEWVREHQAPLLATRYRKQFDDRIESLQALLANVHQAIAVGRLDRQGEADQISAEITWLSELVA